MHWATLFAMTAALWAQDGQFLIDRVAVTVGSSAITETEILEEVRITALLNGEKPDFSPKSRREAAERLIDQQLIRRDMRAIRFPEPENSEANRLIARLRKERFGNEGAYQNALQQYGVNERQLKEHLLWQLAALRFTDYRFRAPGQKPDERLAFHLEREAGERAADRTGASPRTDEAPPESDIDRQMDEWLKQSRERTRIRFNQEAFR